MNKKSQIWVETVVYTLIGLVIIGVLLSIVKPSIEKRQDRVLIEKSLEILSVIDEQVEEIKHYGPGNSRTVEINLKKGKLDLNVKEDSIEFAIDSLYMYSELNQEVNAGDIVILTEGKDGDYEISLKLSYLGILNLTWNNAEKSQIFQPAPVDHKITITNMGKREERGNLTQIDFS